MKQLLLSLIILIASTTAIAQSNWYADKYSMFVHYGLYSIPAGVFDGKPIERGYSEQILTFGIGFSDWYEAYTREFTAEHFDADKIVALAKAGGMRSVVMTSKHHDGFCLFDTKTTDYNVMNTPAGRDLLGELAEACHREGIGFGIYFSLIDWHYPYAMPFSSHNADAATPPHHEYNKAQVRELLTKYGRVDELWFDMGSLTNEQSAELYALVHELQPHCMVSGRLGNDYADFCVMADNEYPDYLMAMPWQTAASMFDETWGYRSWQERGEVEDKVKEKLASLIKVVAYGGKYLLNIGPMGDGTIVPFESEVIKRIGAEIEPISSMLYNTHPAAEGDALATISADWKTRYSFVLKGGAKPAGSTLVAHNTYYDVYAQPWKAPREKPLSGPLTTLQAKPLFAHSSADYYASFRSIVGYEWAIGKRKTITLSYTDTEVGRTLLVNGKELHLAPQKTTYVPIGNYEWGALEEAKQRGRMATISEQPEWSPSLDHLQEGVSLELGFSQGKLYRQHLQAPEAQLAMFDITYSDGVLVYLNGTYIDGGIHREAGNGKLSLCLPLRRGDNELLIKVYNRWNRDAYLQVAPRAYTAHEQRLSVSDNHLRITKLQQAPLASPAHLSNIRIE
ncbi:alpha-L-fucosidase [Porphyromonas levii]|uniref:alpha-L-fucosidase n=1 Tax=Porphyromonas levii TaxID=28114 RepID=A0A4Y8WPY2_9PORP|nr:alpha-L-fucosidase [Porphyromonas levii]TFH95329.1 hypothetical protein E4P47_04780 [Porphyromonas levii]TFH95905.1 hypothetical protein E4P48_06545 [Porphyromonas levii]